MKVKLIVHGSIRCFHHFNVIQKSQIAIVQCHLHVELASRARNRYEILNMPEYLITLEN